MYGWENETFSFCVGVAIPVLFYLISWARFFYMYIFTMNRHRLCAHALDIIRKLHKMGPTESTDEK